MRSPMPRSLARRALAPLALLLVAHARAQEEGKKDVALQPLAASLSAYLEARSNGAGLDAPKSALSAGLQELSKVLGGDPLQHPAELGRALWLAGASPKSLEHGGKIATGTFVGGSFSGAGLGYAYRLPRDSDPARSYPLILAIPGDKEEPAEHLRVQWTLHDIQEHVILLCPAMPAQRETWDQVVVKGRPGGLCHVLTALRIAAERFDVDFERVFV